MNRNLCETCFNDDFDGSLYGIEEHCEEDCSANIVYGVSLTILKRYIIMGSDWGFVIEYNPAHENKANLYIEDKNGLHKQENKYLVTINRDGAEYIIMVKGDEWEKGFDKEMWF